MDLMTVARDPRYTRQYSPAYTIATAMGSTEYATLNEALEGWTRITSQEPSKDLRRALKAGCMYRCKDCTISIN